MNPFVTLLVVIPLFVSTILMIGSVFGIVKHGLKWDILTAFTIFASICAYLTLFLKKTVQKPLLEFPGSDAVSISIQKKITAFFLAVVYSAFGLMGLLLLLFNFKSVKNWLGVVCFILGLLMCYSGFFQLRKGKPSQFRESQESLASQHNRLVRTKKYLLSASIVTSFSIIFLYHLGEGSKFFSIFDLFGFLFLLFSSVSWLILKEFAVGKN